MSNLFPGPSDTERSILEEGIRKEARNRIDQSDRIWERGADRESLPRYNLAWREIALYLGVAISVVGVGFLLFWLRG